MFVQNLAKIESHNSKGHSWTMEANKFADLTDQEFKAGYLGLDTSMDSDVPTTPVLGCSASFPSGAARSVDYTKTGGVTAVKDQGHCGSCWSFTSTASLEFCHWKATGKLVSFSEQQLIDCSQGKWGNHGCNGGNYMRSFLYSKTNGNMPESSYPYKGTDGSCKYDKSKAVKTSSKGFENFESSCPSALIQAVSKRVVSVSVDATEWKYYKGGIMSSSQCGTHHNHGVAAVGYNMQGSSGYLKIKNSWGARWGESGFIRM